MNKETNKLEVKDLRVTNFIESDGVEMPVAMIGFDAVQLFTTQGNLIQARLDLIKPIELTPDWLDKFGFDCPAHSFIGSIFHLTEWDSCPLNWAVTFNINNAVIVKKLKYVHELQNLYFALTGEELLIN